MRTHFFKTALFCFLSFSLAGFSQDAPIFISGSVNHDGSRISVQFSKAMADPAGKEGEFALTSDGVMVPISQLALSATDLKVVEFTPSSNIEMYKDIKLSYTSGTVLASDGGALGTYTKRNIANRPNFAREIKILPSNSNHTFHLGIFVSISGNIAVISDQSDVYDYGSTVYFYVWDGISWIKQEQFLAGIYGGNRLSLDKHFLLVGNPELGSATRGRASIWAFDGVSWGLEETFIASDRENGDQFGSAVSISGDHIIVGSKAGKAYMYRFDGSAWGNEQILLTQDFPVSRSFGESVSISGNKAVVGAYYPVNNYGNAFVYNYNGSEWELEQKLEISDSQANEAFGRAVYIEGSKIAVGALNTDDYKGAAYIFAYDGISWSQEQKITASDGIDGDVFGQSVSINGDKLAVTALGGNRPGAAYIYTYDGCGWGKEQKISATNSERDDVFGYNVSMDGDYIIMGAWGDDDMGNRKGAGYFYQTQFLSAQAPVLTSNCGEATALIYVDENQTAVTTVTASDTDGDGINYSISGGADQALFSIDPVSGALSFSNAPDYEIPGDTDADNNYIVEVKATDNSPDNLLDVQIITVIVNDVIEGPPEPAVEVTLGGYIHTQKNVPLVGVEVILAGAENLWTTTDEFGWYSFNVLSTQEYHITPLFDTDADDGVTTLDIAMMYWQHLGIRDIMSNYDLIASDVNDSKSLSSLDIAQTRAVILHNIDKFFDVELNDRNAVEFINKDYDGVIDAFDHQKALTIIPTQSYLDLNFMGVKLGDAGNNWDPTRSNARMPGLEEMELRLDVPPLAGNSVIVPLKSQDFSNIIGLQFTLEWNPEAVRFDQLRGQQINLISNLDLADQGLLTITWNSKEEQGLSLDEQSILSTFEFTALDASIDPDIKISSGITPALAYNSSLETMTVKSSMDFKATLIPDDVLIYPNPAKDYIYISGGGQAEIKYYTILNILGIQVQEGKLDSKKSISMNKLLPGIYIIQLTFADGKVYNSEVIKQ